MGVARWRFAGREAGSEVHALKVLMVIERYLPIWGGAENQLRQLCPNLLDAGCDITIMTRRWSENMPQSETIDGVPVKRVGLPIKGLAGTVCFVLALLWQLLRQGRKFDVIHSHGAAALGALCSLAARLSGSRNMSKIATAGRIPKLRGNLVGRVLLFLFKRSDAVVCLSHEIYDELMAIGIAPDRIAWIPNSVDVARFKPGLADARLRWRRARGFGESDLVVVFCGRLVARKGPDVLLEAWQPLTERHPNVRLLLLGDGRDQPDSIVDRLHQIVARWPVQDVIFEGAVDKPEDYLAVADIFVLPSFKEGAPNALLEAMAAGLATVSSKIGGVEDLVADGETGLMFPAGDASALTKTLSGLIEDRKRRNEIGAAARRHVMDQFSVAAIAQCYIDAYKLLMDNRRVGANICDPAAKKI